MPKLGCPFASSFRFSVFSAILRSAAIPALADASLTSELYDKAFADFAMSNLGVSIAANASNQTKPEGK